MIPNHMYSKNFCGVGYEPQVECRISSSTDCTTPNGFFHC